MRRNLDPSFADGTPAFAPTELQRAGVLAKCREYRSQLHRFQSDRASCSVVEVQNLAWPDMDSRAEGHSFACENQVQATG